MFDMTTQTKNNNELIEKNYQNAVRSQEDIYLKSKQDLFFQETESRTSNISLKSFKGNDDFGHIVHKDNVKTFYPSTIGEISDLVGMSQQCKMPIVCRGQGHSTYGQSQIENGLVLDLSQFSKIQAPTTDSITVECGAKWKDVLKVSLQSGLTPPALTDYLGLSVGGVLSVGGIGGQTHQHGLVADNVVELKVMTMDGKVHQCSRTDNADLFHASLTTLGQFTIILEATIKLMPAPKTCQIYNLYYDDLQTFIEDQTFLVQNKVCNYLEGQIVKLGLNPQIDESLSAVTKKDWCYMIEAALYDYQTSDKPTLDLKTLHPLLVKDEEKTYNDFANRMKPGVKFLKNQGSWNQQHPWINLFLPSDQIFKTVNNMMQTISLEDTGGWPVLMYPINKSALWSEYFQAPESEIIWVLALLRNSPDSQTSEKLIEKNRLLYADVKNKGGTLYPIGSTPMNYDDWKNHFKNWKTMKLLKRESDPYHLLGRGLGIFPPPGF